MSEKAAPPRSSFTSNAHDLAFPRGYCCPITGYEIPKDDGAEHREWRARLRAALATPGPHRRHIWEACRSSFEFFTDAFVWTPKSMEVDATGKQLSKAGEGTYRPYITWPVHLGLHKEFRRCIAEGDGLAIPKSRDMRATWHMLIEAVHDLLFNRDARILMLSRIQDLADGPDPDALLPRVRDIIKRLPGYFAQDIQTRFKQVANVRLGNSLDASATTEDVGVGGRRLWMLYDEAARNRHMQESWDATRNVTSTRVVLSTFHGPNAFRDIVFSGLPIFPIGYWDHPDKGRGRVLRKDDSGGTYTGKPNSLYWWTPWFEKATRDPKNPRSRIDISQNELMDPDVAGNVVFDVDVLMRHMARARVTPPKIVGDIVSRKKRGEERDLALQALDRASIAFAPSVRGRLKLWCPLVKDKHGKMRPPQNEAYVLFADPSQGQGQANSTIAIGSVDRGVKVGMLADPTLEPHELARVLIMLGLWFGGTTEFPMIGWETNGAGLTVQRHLEELEWPATEPWTSNRDAKMSGMEALRDAYAADKLVDYDLETLKEAGDYIILPGGKIEPQKLREDRDALATHGDRVIATMGLWLMMRDHDLTPRTNRRPKEGSDEWFIEKRSKQSDEDEDEE